MIWQAILLLIIDASKKRYVLWAISAQDIHRRQVYKFEVKPQRIKMENVGDSSCGLYLLWFKFFTLCDRDIDGVLKSANGTEYGLASGVFTTDINKAMYVADNLDAGTVFVNTYNKTDVASPFGGFKQSGFGKDLGKTFWQVKGVYH